MAEARLVYQLMKNLIVMFAFIGAALALAIFVRRSADQLPEPVRGREVASTPRIETAMPANAPAISAEDKREPGPAPPEVPLAPPLALDQGTLPWEERIESVVRDNSLTNTAKARRLLAMLPGLPEDGFGTAAEECVKCLPDADYNVVALPVITNPQTHGAVANVLFADLMERPDAITLPALLRIAQIPNHPYATFAQENLQLLIGEDFGNNWPEWDAAIRTALTRKVE